MTQIRDPSVTKEEPFRCAKACPLSRELLNAKVVLAFLYLLHTLSVRMMQRGLALCVCLGTNSFTLHKGVRYGRMSWCSI